MSQNPQNDLQAVTLIESGDQASSQSSQPIDIQQDLNQLMAEIQFSPQVSQAVTQMVALSNPKAESFHMCELFSTNELTILKDYEGIAAALGQDGPKMPKKFFLTLRKILSKFSFKKRILTCRQKNFFFQQGIDSYIQDLKATVSVTPAKETVEAAPTVKIPVSIPNQSEQSQVPKPKPKKKKEMTKSQIEAQNKALAQKVALMEKQLEQSKKRPRQDDQAPAGRKLIKPNESVRKPPPITELTFPSQQVINQTWATHGGREAYPRSSCGPCQISIDEMKKLAPTQKGKKAQLGKNEQVIRSGSDFGIEKLGVIPCANCLNALLYNLGVYNATLFDLRAKMDPLLYSVLHQSTVHAQVATTRDEDLSTSNFFYELDRQGKCSFVAILGYNKNPQKIPVPFYNGGILTRNCVQWVKENEETKFKVKMSQGYAIESAIQRAAMSSNGRVKSELITDKVKPLILLYKAAFGNLVDMTDLRTKKAKQIAYEDI